MQSNKALSCCFSLFLGIFVVFATVMHFSVVQAHEQRPAIVDFSLGDSNNFEFRILTNAEALIAEIGAEHSDTSQSPNAAKYDALRTLSPEELVKAFGGFKEKFKNAMLIFFDEQRTLPLSVIIEPGEVGDTELARDSYIYVTGELPEGVETFEWNWPEQYGASVIRVTEPGKALDEGYSAFLNAGVSSDKISLKDAKPLGFWRTVKDYIIIGFEHILPKGLDHILFVVGLFLLSVKLGPLLWQVTAFTLAHTVTLALGILGYITISPTIVEPIIAASIVYVAVENIITDKLHRWRPAIIFCFGLLHGLGFAGVLGEIGLSSSQFVAGLISFNIGVELGQLTVIAICFLTVGIWFGQKPWYRKFISIPASVVIALIASWWVYERVFLGG